MPSTHAFACFSFQEGGEVIKTEPEVFFQISLKITLLRNAEGSQHTVLPVCESFSISLIYSSSHVNSIVP